jgi:hypothetical protein
MCINTCIIVCHMINMQIYDDDWCLLYPATNVRRPVFVKTFVPPGTQTRKYYVIPVQPVPGEPLGLTIETHTALTPRDLSRRNEPSVKSAQYITDEATINSLTMLSRFSVPRSNLPVLFVHALRLLGTAGPHWPPGTLLQEPKEMSDNGVNRPTHNAVDNDEFGGTRYPLSRPFRVQLHFIG